MNDVIVLSLDEVSKSYGSGTTYLPILEKITLRIRRGEVVSIMGPSGSGKSTLLHIAGILDPPDTGTVTIDGVDAWNVKENERALLRNRKLGFVFQFHHLLEEFTLLENIAMPLLLAGYSRSDSTSGAMELMEATGIAERSSHFPSQVSGGERQRAAVARALVGNPAVVLADEPTGSLDAKNSALIESMLFRLSSERKQAFVIVTHSRELAEKGDRCFRLEGGVLHCT